MATDERYLSRCACGCNAAVEGEPDAVLDESGRGEYLNATHMSEHNADRAERLQRLMEDR